MKKVKYTIANNKQNLLDYLKLVKGEPLCFDTETTGLEYLSPILGISFYTPKAEALFVPIDTYFEGYCSLEEVSEALKEVEFDKYEAIAHNGKYDQVVLKSNGLVQPNLIADTLIMVHLYDTEAKKKLEIRVKEDLGVKKLTFEELIKKKWNRINWIKDIKSGEITLEVLAEYACEDVYYTYRLWDYYSPKLEKENLWEVHDKIELPLIKVLTDMKCKGVNIDHRYLEELSPIMEEEISKQQESIYKEAGCIFNLNSPKQKGEVLFDKMKLPCHRETKTGGRSTDSKTLEILSNEGYEIADYMLKYSELQKLNSGYVQSIPRMVDYDGRLRADFNSVGTKTGRFSSSSPNLQNQPNNDDYPIRKIYIPTPGNVFGVADYSQIELRVMAHVSKDEKFTEIFNAGGDPHGDVATRLGITRSHAKIVNFGILYGMGPETLGNNLGISSREASSIIRGYESTYSGYYKWKLRTERFASENHYIRNIFGRVRRLPFIGTSSAGHYAGLRQAVNTVIQGSAADVIKLAMIELWKEWQKKDAHILLQVHDELVTEFPIHIAEECYDDLIRIMENTIKLRVPLEADGKICTDWSQMKDKNFNSLTIDKSIPLWAIV